VGQKTPDETRKLHLPENHERGIGTTLLLFDELLCRVEEWTAGREVKSTLYRVRNSLTQAQRSRLRNEIADLRRVLLSAKERLDLAPPAHDAVVDIWSRCAAFRENLMALESRHLRRYGKVPPDLAKYMDALALELLERLDGIIRVVSLKAD